MYDYAFKFPSIKLILICNAHSMQTYVPKVKYTVKAGFPLRIASW